MQHTRYYSAVVSVRKTALPTYRKSDQRHKVQMVLPLAARDYSEPCIHACNYSAVVCTFCFIAGACLLFQIKFVFFTWSLRTCTFNKFVRLVFFRPGLLATITVIFQNAHQWNFRLHSDNQIVKLGRQRQEDIRKYLQHECSQIICI